MTRIYLTRHGQTVKWALTQFLRDPRAVYGREVRCERDIVDLLDERGRTIDDFTTFAGELPERIRLSDLTQRGREQAKILGRYISSRISDLYPYFLTSDSPRTIESADIIAAEMRCPRTQENSREATLFSERETKLLRELRQEGTYLRDQLVRRCPPHQETVAVLHAKVNAVILEAIGEISLDCSYENEFVFDTGSLVVLNTNENGLYVEIPYQSNDELAKKSL